MTGPARCNVELSVRRSEESGTHYKAPIASVTLYITPEDLAKSLINAYVSDLLATQHICG